MSTYTPNYNLSKPEVTDTQADFISDYCDNMDIIDSNLGGGGGSGGHTIVDENGSTMPTRSKLQFVGGVSVTDDSLNDSTIVDIVGGSGRDLFTPLYTGTQHENTINLSESFRNYEGILVTAYSGGVNGWHISQVYKNSELNDGERFTLSDEGSYLGYYITDDTTLTFAGGSGYYIEGVYGIANYSPTFFSEYASACYDTNEREVGCWIDGKPLYQKTVDIGSLPSNDTKTVAHGVSDIDLIVSCKGFVYNGSYTFLSLPSINVDSLTYGVQLESDRTNISVKTKESWFNVYSGFVTIQYTKTTDVPGSGKLTPTAMPTVHYSTNEQVIGTWIDNKPLYQKTLKGNSDPNNTSIRVDVSALDLETICNAYLVANSSTSSTQDYYYDNSDHLRWYYDDKVNKYLTIEYGGNYPIRPFEWCLTLQYTKTTD